MIKYADRVLETSTSQGTGTINLAGATAGFQSFVAGVGNGNKCVYFIEDGVDWEAGVGTVTAGPPDTLSRDRILESSNSGAAVDWGPGTRNVFLGASSHALLWRDENGNDTNETGAGGGTANAQTVTYPNERAGYSDGMLIRWIATVENTGAMTVNVNGLGAKSYVQNDGTAFAAGQVPIGSLQQAVYDLANDRFMSLGATTAAGITIDDAGFVVFTATNLQDFADEVDALADGVAKINVKATDIATAATVNLDASTGDYVALTGTTTVTAITLAEGQERTVRAAGAFVLTHGANLILPTGANITTAAGDVFIVRGEAAGVVRVVGYMRANGNALISALGASSLTNDGYQVFSSGLILQWGQSTASLAANGNVTLNFPLTFPNAPLMAVAGTRLKAAGSDQCAIGVNTLSTTQINIINDGGAASANGVYYFAIGY